MVTNLYVLYTAHGINVTLPRHEYMVPLIEGFGKVYKPLI